MRWSLNFLKVVVYSGVILSSSVSPAMCKVAVGNVPNLPNSVKVRYAGLFTERDPLATALTGRVLESFKQHASLKILEFEMAEFKDGWSNGPAIYVQFRIPQNIIDSVANNEAEKSELQNLRFVWGLNPKGNGNVNEEDLSANDFKLVEGQNVTINFIRQGDDLGGQYYALERAAKDKLNLALWDSMRSSEKLKINSKFDDVNYIEKYFDVVRNGNPSTTAPYLPLFEMYFYGLRVNL